MTLLDLLDAWGYLLVLAIVMPLYFADFLTVREYWRCCAAAELALTPLSFVNSGPAPGAVRFAMGLVFWWVSTKFDDSDKGRKRRRALSEKVKAKFRQFAPSPLPKPVVVGVR